MIDWRHVAGFDWDEGNARKSEDKHGVLQSEAEQIFFNQPLLVLADDRHSKKEMRFHVLGKTDDAGELHVTFTLRDEGTLIRVISARDMHHKERLVYGKAKKST